MKTMKSNTQHHPPPLDQRPAVGARAGPGNPRHGHTIPHRTVTQVGAWDAVTKPKKQTKTEVTNMKSDKPKRTRKRNYAKLISENPLIWLA